MKDIETRHDIENLLTDFYAKALHDEVIGYIFTDVAKLDLAEHLPIISDFWEMVLLGNMNYQQKYQRSPMQVHLQLNEKSALKPEHFKRWLKLFNQTINENFVGAKAELAKQRAASIADAMLIKMNISLDS